MRLFGVGTEAESPRAAATAAPAVVSTDDPPRRALGTTGIEVYPLMFGTGEFGWNAGPDAVGEMLDRYREHGGNAVHTSDGFAGGRADHMLGQWMQTRGCRDDLVVAARVGAHADNPGLGPTNLVRAVEATLGRLGTDRIDVLYLDGTSDEGALLEDTLATGEWLRESGKIRVLGAFGFTAAGLVEARILAAAGYPRIEVIDEPYNLVHRQPFEGDQRLVATAQALAVTPSRAMEHGFLSGRRAPTGAGLRGQQLRRRRGWRGARVIKALEAVGAECGVPPAAVALAWLLAQPGILAPIVNPYALAHVDELVQGAGLALSRAHLAELTRAGD